MIHGVMDFLNLPWPPISSHIYASCLSVSWNLEIPRSTAFGVDRVSDLIYIVLTPLISQFLMASTIFRHFWHKKKHLVFTTFTLTLCPPAPKTAELHEKRRSNPWAYTSTKTHIYTPINKILFPTKPMQIRKFKSKSIKTCTSQSNKNMIHNLSNHTLT